MSTYNRIFFMALIASVLALCFVSSADAAKESRASRAILDKRAHKKTHKKSSSSSSSSSGGKFSGKGTWFIPSSEGGSAGACGPSEKDNAMIVALNAPQYGSMSSKSKYCGKTVRITHGSNSVEAVINDACPGCKFGSLDLTQPVFEKLGSLKTGILDIQWEIV